MFLNINRHKLLNCWIYNPKRKWLSGVENGIEWTFLKRKQISSDRYIYLFTLTTYNSLGGSVTSTRIITTGDFSIKKIVEQHIKTIENIHNW